MALGLTDVLLRRYIVSTDQRLRAGANASLFSPVSSGSSRNHETVKQHLGTVIAVEGSLERRDNWQLMDFKGG
jgi:hypothetical protein